MNRGRKTVTFLSGLLSVFCCIFNIELHPLFRHLKTYSSSTRERVLTTNLSTSIWVDTKIAQINQFLVLNLMVLRCECNLLRKVKEVYVQFKRRMEVSVISINL